MPNVLVLPYRQISLKCFTNSKWILVWMSIVVLILYLIDAYLLTVDHLHTPNASSRRLTGRNGKHGAFIPTDSTEKKNDNSDERKDSMLINNSTSVVAQDDGVHDDDIIINCAALSPCHVDNASEICQKIRNSCQSDYNAVNCGLAKACPVKKYSYFVRSGFLRTGLPIICFNGEYIVTPATKNANRGLNIVVINEKTLRIEDVRNFDVYEDDKSLQRYLQLSIPNHRILLAASQDEASNHLTAESRELLHQFGSSRVDKLRFRDSFVIAGQRGLTRGTAIERVCPGFQMGRLNAVPIHHKESTNGSDSPIAASVTALPLDLAEVTVRSGLGEERVNCGVQEDCKQHSFSVHMYTGWENKDLPKICVNGKYVLGGGVADAGRGFNLAVVDPVARSVIRVGHFDTFYSDSSNLEIFLELLVDGQILIAVTYDEASSKLSDHAKSLFASLGSTLIQDVRFRDVWIFVGQKGIVGFTDIEQIEYAGISWPTPIDKRLCVPTHLQGSQIKPDPLVGTNGKRREFCARNSLGFGHFCDVQYIDEPLTPAPLTDKFLDKHPLFDIPILVIAGLNMNALRMQLETLLMNPGIHVDVVTVVYDENLTDIAAPLVELFNFRSTPLPSDNKYMTLTANALEVVWLIHPNAKHVIVLEEEVIPAYDFLSLVAQCLPVVDADDSLVGVSAWNENGYKGVSTRPSEAYRTEIFPGLGFLLKRTVYEERMRGRMNRCCTSRSWDGWSLRGRLKEDLEMIVPDVSRVFRRPYEGLTNHALALGELFNRPRITNFDPTARLQGLEILIKENYETELHRLIAQSITLSTDSVSDCWTGQGLGFSIPDTTDQFYSIYFEQRDQSDESLLARLARCFQLFHTEGQPVRGKHRGLVRFTYNSNDIFLVGSSTDYYIHRPAHFQSISLTL